MNGWFDRAAATWPPEDDTSAEDSWQLPEPAPESSGSFPAISAERAAQQAPRATSVPEEEQPATGAHRQIRRRQPQIIGPAPQPKTKGRRFWGKG
ncbi:hypothetical protein [Corynebacterium aquilae]|uniref:Uncharacterized protein n=1 Tax=Corynebacterium aquilae DSM 44791 TaxID=1431546 RepID=A0A1L7CI32_9CORY|nr:hypothetical protein [Corynebacterium aquilae]APT85511.1 hypothetical protein CAQU_11145 [Corynebacterium aquilae DSM 44791]